MARVEMFNKKTDGEESKQSMAEMLADDERKFRQACVQLTLINKQLDDCKVRYGRAKREQQRSFRYNLRLKVAVMEGVRNMYYDYAYMKAEHVSKLRHDMFGEVLNSSSDAEE